MICVDQDFKSSDLPELKNTLASNCKSETSYENSNQGSGIKVFCGEVILSLNNCKKVLYHEIIFFGALNLMFVQNKLTKCVHKIIKTF